MAGRDLGAKRRQFAGHFSPEHGLIPSQFGTKKCQIVLRGHLLPKKLEYGGERVRLHFVEPGFSEVLL